MMSLVKKGIHTSDSAGVPIYDLNYPWPQCAVHRDSNTKGSNIRSEDSTRSINGDLHLIIRSKAEDNHWVTKKPILPI